MPIHSALRLSVVHLPTDKLVARPGVEIRAQVGGIVSVSWPAPKARARDQAVELTPGEARRLAEALLSAAAS